MLTKFLKEVIELRKVKALLLGLIVLAVALLPTVSFKSPTVAADPNNDDWLHVEGNKIVTCTVIRSG